MRARLIIVFVLGFAGVSMFGQGVWIYAKAHVAQWLLARAWSRTLHGEAQAKPWQWADTWPVARIDFPRQDAHYIVLAGASGRTMAFGPGHVDGTADPGEQGNCVITAHRDTQFAVLREVWPGDEIVVHNRRGVAVRYRVIRTGVTHERDTSALTRSEGRRLTLLTCYPFDGMVPGTELRYMVVARGV